MVVVGPRAVDGMEVSESSAEAERGLELGNSSSSLSFSSSSASSSSSEAEAWSAMKDGRPRLPVGADLRRGAVVVLVGLEVGRGGLKVGALRLGRGLEVVGMAEEERGGTACSPE